MRYYGAVLVRGEIDVDVAFFDLDRTLIAKNSGVLWLRREFTCRPSKWSGDPWRSIRI